MESISELINAVNTTPFRTIALVLGFLALSVGYGLKIKAVIDVDNINKTYAKTVGAILLVVGVILFMPDISKQPGMKDPFLPYYIVSVFVAVVFTGMILKYTSGLVQLKALKGFFLLLAIFVSFVILWRGIVIYFYVAGSGNSEPPLGFGLSGGNYLPYLVLLSAGISVIAWLIYAYTERPENSENRLSIFQYFIVFCVYLGACRVVWEVVDSVGKEALLSR